MSAATSAPAAATPATPQRVVIVPGNGCGNIERANWYVWVANELRKHGCDVRLRSMPDPNEAKRYIWIPFIVNELGADENTVLIGHSSGAVAGLRLLEEHRLKGFVCVSGCHTDLGMESEAISGYYPHDDGSNPWKWYAIPNNAEWIVQLHSEDDPFIPIEEARFVHEKTKSEYIEHKNRNHYMEKHLQDVVDIVVKKCGLTKQQE